MGHCRVSHLPRLLLLVLGLFAACPRGGAEDLSSVGLDRLSGFWEAVETARGPVGVMAFGDSLQAPWRSLGGHMNKRLSRKIGFAGYSMGVQDRPVAVAGYDGGAAVLPPDGFWWMPSSSLPAGGSIDWSNMEHPVGSLLADRVGLFYLAGTSPFRFSVLVSSNGGAWTRVASVSSGVTNPRSHHASFELPLGFYRLRVQGEMGTARILGPEMFDSQSRGIRSIFLARDGCNLNHILGVPSSVLLPVLSALDPALVHWHMKEYRDLGAQTLTNRLRELDAVWRAAIPRASVLYLGTPYEQRDAVDSPTLWQNRIVRAAVIRDGRSYLDLMTPFGPYETMVANGYLDDDVHPSNAFYEEAARMAWYSCGFFALGHDRSLGAEIVGGRQVVSFMAGSDNVYRLESSTNLIDWVPRTYLQGPGGQDVLGVRYTNELAHSALYRLILLPNPLQP